MKKPKPIVLIILDGWGYQPQDAYNAINQARTPVWDNWWQTMPHMLLEASGESVGLPPGQMGNSEVGHMHIGAGRVIYQDYTRINQAIDHNKFIENNVLNHLIRTLQSGKSALHIGGLLSTGGVHSHEDHLFALIDILAPAINHPVHIHCFLDGRDSPPQSALDSLERLAHKIENHPSFRIASLCGRYYAMDRDKRWERTEKAYRCIVDTHCEFAFDNHRQALEYFYSNSIHDEFVPPSRIGNPHPLTDGDCFLFFNFRADRARQLTQALISPDFSHFSRPSPPALAEFVSMTRYSDKLPTAILFPPQELNNTLGKILADRGLRQLRIAETEKYAHVTFFFNGGMEAVFPGEDRVLIDSPKVATYDLQPEMSAPELTCALQKAIDSGKYDVIVCNYANADMVGHTGNMAAAIEAIETLDTCLHKVAKSAEQKGGCLLITSDHGNAEQMFDETSGQPHTAHTRQPVPLLFVGKDWAFNRQQGCLTDIAPSILRLLGISQPDEMSGQNLLVAKQ